MINWKEYIESRIRFRCNFCREWFDEMADIKVHLVKEHDVMDIIDIKICKVCKNPFVPVLDEQIICGRRICILNEDKTLLSEVVL